jgi:hypothetical protein
MTLNVIASPFRPEKGGNCYTIEIPEYMTRTYQLNDVATLQYQNVAKEAYTIVIDDSKDQLHNLGVKFIDSKDFLDNFTATYMEGAENRKISETTKFESNNNKHAQCEMSWSNEGIDFFMLITVVETNNNYYKILSWTIQDNKSTLYDDFVKISKSLQD